MLFPIVIEDPPSAPQPEPRLEFVFGCEVICSLPTTAVYGALQSLVLDGGARNFVAGQAVLIALQEIYSRMDKAADLDKKGDSK